MAKLNRFLKQRGFTLIEILVVIVIIGVLSIMGVSKYTEFTTQSRQRGCVSNQNSIDKAVGVWESQNVAIPAVAAVNSIVFSTSGKITASNFNALAAPTGSRLLPAAPDNAVIYNYTKDLNVFTCPERANIAGGEAINSTGVEPSQYSWQISNAAIAVLQGKTRGTVCNAFNLNGPDGTTGTYHRQ